ncbi:hypothetical protein Tcan_07255 [Toxocara canis]|uniref:Uncharacterized protein n=1 Tax=Toxocara canis TaxID=6265 RepID=A0A0B2UNW7_TOXCA|nr:hypothetical protein Tcan_07255 [Toxocara canis]
MSSTSNRLLLVSLLCALLAVMPSVAQFYGGFGWPWFGYGGYGGFGGYGGYGYGFGGYGCCGWGYPYYGLFYGKR